ncbi:period circadian protein [Gracilaria domingensis]|nr:period circadian protein [Gracilaria domingensis]
MQLLRSDLDPLLLCAPTVRKNCNCARALENKLKQFGFKLPDPAVLTSPIMRVAHTIYKEGNNEEAYRTVYMHIVEKRSHPWDTTAASAAPAAASFALPNPPNPSPKSIPYQLVPPPVSIAPSSGTQFLSQLFAPPGANVTVSQGTQQPPASLNQVPQQSPAVSTLGTTFAQMQDSFARLQTDHSSQYNQLRHLVSNMAIQLQSQQPSQQIPVSIGVSAPLPNPVHPATTPFPAASAPVPTASFVPAPSPTIRPIYTPVPAYSQPATSIPPPPPQQNPALNIHQNVPNLLGQSYASGSINPGANPNHPGTTSPYNNDDSNRAYSFQKASQQALTYFKDRRFSGTIQQSWAHTSLEFEEYILEVYNLNAREALQLLPFTLDGDARNFYNLYIRPVAVNYEHAKQLMMQTYDTEATRRRIQNHLQNIRLSQLLDGTT